MSLWALGKARVHELHHHEAAAGGVAPVELVPEVPSEDVANEETAGGSLEVVDENSGRGELRGTTLRLAQASEEEDVPRN